MKYPCIFINDMVKYETSLWWLPVVLYVRWNGRRVGRGFPLIVQHLQFNSRLLGIHFTDHDVHPTAFLDHLLLKRRCQLIHYPSIHLITNRCI